MIWVSLLLAALILTFFVRVGLRQWDLHQDGDRFTRRQFLHWALKGLALPILIWVLLNAGVSPRFPSLVQYGGPATALATGVPRWFWLLLPTAFVVSSFWAATTFAWLIAVHAIEMETSGRDIAGAAVLWVVLLSPVLALILYVGGMGSVGLATLILLAPVLREQFAFGTPKRKPIHPSYAQAIAKIKAGNYGAAEREVIRQLEKSDSDFEGWMILADLYANQFDDLPEAERLVHEVCRQPDVTSSQMADALNRLADWYLKANNRRAAVRVLEQICEAFPATHRGDLAMRRIKQLTPWAFDEPELKQEELPPGFFK
jgi:hypothetical protein